MDIDLATAIEALASITLTEIGLRRRTVEQLLAREAGIVAGGLGDNAVALLARCLEETHDVGWKTRAREMRDRLTNR
ncbi:hypothetical protein ABZ769_05380 [Streptomyces olivoreticuli]